MVVVGALQSCRVVSIRFPLSSIKGGLAAGGLKGWMRALTALFVPL